MMKLGSRTLLIMLMLISNVFGAGIEETFGKVFEFLDNGIVQSIAVLLMVGLGLLLAFGNVQKFKVEMYCLVAGIAIVYSAKEIAEAVF